MKTFTYTIDGKQLSLTLSSGRVAEIKMDGRALKPTDEEMAHYAAVIALALIQYEVVEVHDDETGTITLKPQQSVWSEPVEMFNGLE